MLCVALHGIMSNDNAGKVEFRVNPEATISGEEKKYIIMAKWVRRSIRLLRFFPFSEA